jgi:hypothetical protein
MKTRMLLLSLLTVVSIFTSCKKDQIEIIPSSNVSSVEKSVSIDNKLEVSGPFRVHLTFSTTEESVIIEANDNLHRYIDVENKNGWLKVRLRNNLNFNSRHGVLNVYITTSKINEYQIQGAASVFLENELYAANTNIDLDGACFFSGTLYSNNLYADLSGASKLELSGSTMLLDVKGEGACAVKNYGFEVAQLDADLNGASEVYVSVSESLKVRANGGSNVYYKGNGVIRSQDLSGGSSIKKMD